MKNDIKNLKKLTIVFVGINTTFLRFFADTLIYMGARRDNIIITKSYHNLNLAIQRKSEIDIIFTDSVTKIQQTVKDKKAKIILLVNGKKKQSDSEESQIDYSIDINSGTNLDKTLKNALLTLDRKIKEKREEK